ncbi:putative ribonuclease H-like domain-containing protein [Tanacetum coccineum]|uniref:Ribonuclease H-like domain-containing protein n=1 Tax=Tanacetum coccineum TaxID=301880 RepID=A0ABQ4WYH3_9ASTR
MCVVDHNFLTNGRFPAYLLFSAGVAAYALTASFLLYCCGGAYAFYQDKASLVRVLVANVTQMSDKKNGILFTNTECVVLSPDFKLTDESQVLLKVPRKDNMYNVDLKNVVPQGGLTCLFAKATPDQSNLWHKRLGHVNFKTTNKLVKGNLVRGLPLKLFKINQTCVACLIRRKATQRSC